MKNNKEEIKGSRIESFKLLISNILIILLVITGIILLLSFATLIFKEAITDIIRQLKIEGIL
jgi:hypothetical protein